MIIGPTPWWQSNIVKSCPVGTTLPDGSRIICKAGGTAWIVAPACTEVGSTWANSAIVGCVSPTGDLPSVSCWATLCSRLIACGFNPADWFVPNCVQVSTPGYVCRTQWDSYANCCAYWTSTESSSIYAWGICAGGSLSAASPKGTVNCVRAMRCVTY